MRVRILYFAAVRELVGTDDEDLDLPANVQHVAHLAAWLEAHHPALQGRLATVRFALDEDFVGLEAALHDGATVALIPPVAGG